MRSLPVTLYTGEPHDNNTAVIVPTDKSMLAAIYSYCLSDEFGKEVRKLDSSIKVTNAVFEKIPFDPIRWKAIGEERFPLGLPKPHSDDPTQWIFHGNPRTATNPLHVSMARLLGYTWPAEADSSIQLSAESQFLVTQCRELGSMVDIDGIVPIPALRGEQPATDRLREILSATFGAEWSPAKEQELLQLVDYSGKNLDSWLRDGFFDQHCKLFHQRPFLWQVWDGLRDGFSVLVNYHKLDRKGLESLTYSYLGDWVTRQTEAAARSESGAQGKLEKALELQKKLVAILEGEAPYDIFVRWKPIDQQPIGWEPDLNDGVRFNIRPFMTAGVLRKDPKLNWNKDRGKDVESAPWFKVFNGDRINDHHLSLELKREARQRSSTLIGSEEGR
jgi:hypothetical protein